MKHNKFGGLNRVRKVVYKGQDPNIRGKKCDVLHEDGDYLTLGTGDLILGRVEFKVHKDKTERYY